MRWLLLLLFSVQLLADIAQKIFPLTPAPIDVVIPYDPKDQETLELCVEGIRKNGINIGRIIVLSKEQPMVQAEWFAEANFPFTKEAIALEIFRGDKQAADVFLAMPKSRIGWIYQQFLKFYAPFVIPDISPNVLILDSDVIFLNPADFMTAEGHPYFNIGAELVPSYFSVAERLLPGLHRVHSKFSGVTHHMLFQRPILEDLFQLISEHHKMEPWKAICRVIDPEEVSRSCLSEYEIYFNFALLRTPQATIRRLKWCDLSMLSAIPRFKRQYYAYVASHTWLRELHLSLGAQYASPQLRYP